MSTFLRNGGSLETTAKELSVHPNTVRYRLKRAAETTGWDAADAREATCYAPPSPWAACIPPERTATEE